MLPATEQNTDEILALPASSAQQRFWVLDQLKPGDPSLNVAVRFGLTGPLNTELFGRALNEIVQRHEILRASFGMIDGQVMQLVAPSMTIPVPIYDLRHDPSLADRHAAEEAKQPFSLAQAPLLRASLVRLADDEHVLLITIHHIISDGWSIGVITDELGEIYEALVKGSESPLPELPIQYADFTLWQHENQKDGIWSEAEAYWKQQLADLPQFEVMPDWPRSSVPVCPGNILSRLLPMPLTDSLRSLSQKHEATLFMTMLGALTALLHRYTGESDIVVGSQVVGRNSVDVEPLIGPFINTLVLRTDTSGDPVFTELVERVRKTVSEALAHEDLPLERVAEILRVSRSTDRNLMFQVNFIYQRDFVHPWEHAGLRMRPIPSKSPGAMYDLNIFLVERAEGWRVSCEYNTSLYQAETVVQLLEHYERLLALVAGDPLRRISEYGLLNESEERRIVDGWNTTQAEYSRELCVHELVEARAARTPRATAVTFRGRNVSYDELNCRANQFARHLRGQGFQTGDLAGIHLDRSIEMLVAALAVLKAGGAYVPLDPSFPAERLAFMAEDAGLRVLICDGGGWQPPRRLPTCTTVSVRTKGIERESAANLELAVSPDQLAYVIYTSGSTGKPKGVEIHHRAVVNLLEAVVESPGISASDSLLAITTLSFDIAGLELFAPLLAGGRVILASREEASDGLKLRNLVRESGATILQATPATWRMLIDSGWHNTPRLKMLCGGEPLSRELADALLERGGELWNMYGPTETTIWSSWCKVASDGAPISIGRPIANTQFYVLDSKLRPVPVSVPGELFIGGDGVGKGYHNRAELTAEKFVANPFAGGRMYRTGDRARFRADGSVEMLGRMDTQVKIRGFRIELGEVEAALAGCPAVRNGAVVVRDDASGQKALAGYFIPVGDETAETVCTAVRQYLRQRLPDYMVPTFLVSMAELPLTPNGKLDRKALPDPETSKQQNGNGTAHDSLEAMLIGVWEAVLGIQPVRRTDNFFEIGGHSVMAARMFARLEKIIGKTLPLATLFQAPTVAQLASVLRDSGWTPPWSPLVPIRPSGSKPPFYFVHPIGGNVLTFAGFAGHFDPDQPVFGLQARGLDRKEAPNVSIEQMAEDYIEGIRSVQPEGPYYIGGFSAGGIVAYEMARKLRAEGQQVAMLALLDTKVDLPSATTVHAERLIRTIKFNLRYAFHIGLGTFCGVKLKNWRMRSKIRLWMTRDRLGLTTDAHMLDAEEAFLVALRYYTPQSYDGDATLFRAKDELVSYSDVTLGWGSLVRGRLEIREVSGDHDTILQEPHIGMLALVLNSCLSAVQNCFTDSGKALGQSA
ncbi:MAG TPA: amino acid adenylation domain-containing protein [Bryobacteraceae bacterium]|nr:amino acid adenylation domain-containing protein [Bryobacteraceae bacterium]